MLADFRNGEIPGGREPLWSLLWTQAPFRMLLAIPGQAFDHALLHVFHLEAIEMIVVHADRSEDIHPELVAAFHHGLVRVFPALQHRPEPFDVAHRAHGIVLAVFG